MAAISSPVYARVFSVRNLKCAFVTYWSIKRSMLKNEPFSAIALRMTRAHWPRRSQYSGRTSFSSLSESERASAAGRLSRRARCCRSPSPRIAAVQVVAQAPQSGARQGPRYLRLHGNARYSYRYRYPEEELAQIAACCRGTTYVLFNNDHVLEDAQRFQCVLAPHEEGEAQPRRRYGAHIAICGNTIRSAIITISVTTNGAEPRITS